MTMTQSESERRQATIVFADISGFTAMSEKMDPEEVTALMNECFGMLSEIIQRNGGTIDKFIGDCVMALFGVPLAIENAPEKAVISALEMKKALLEFIHQKALTGLLDIHTGINTGIVVSGLIGGGNKKDYTVMGDAVNTASRLKDACGKGQIYVGELTYKATRDEFEYRALEPLTLKGKEQPVQGYELISRKETAGTGKAGTDRMIWSEMVGREAELDKLHLHLLKLINGEGSVVNVIGEAGLGKSRLMAEFARKEEIRKVHYHRGRALSIGKNLSYHPVVDILKNWAGIRENDAGTLAGEKLEKAIRQIAPDEVNEIYPFIATLMGYSLTGRHAERLKGIEGEALEKLILKNFREMLIRGAVLNPLIIEIEDLHWSDTSSLELLISLTRLAEKHRILFIQVFRPGYEETGEKFQRELRERYQEKLPETDRDNFRTGEWFNRAGGGYLELNLRPLNEAQSETLVFNLLRIKGLPAQLRRQIIERSEGNPYFIEEVIRSFIDDGVIEPGRDGFEVTPKIDTVVIPHSINDLLMSRIDRLDEKTRNLVKTASVIGRHFFYRILTQVAEKIEDIDERLRYLETIQMIREGNRREELEYLFKHALAQEAAYESILLARRKELHLHVADSIEKVFSERLPEFYGMLAMHYSKAENMEKAEEYLIKAGEEALRSAASSEALHFYKEALGIYQKKYRERSDPAKVAMMEKNIAMAYFFRGQNVEAIDHFNKVLAYFGVPEADYSLVPLLRVAISLVRMHIFLYLPFLLKLKIPSRQDIEIIMLWASRSMAFSTFNPTNSFIDGITVYNKMTKYDLTSFELGTGIFASGAGMIAWSGLSVRLPKKMVEYRKKVISGQNLAARIRSEWAMTLTFFISGSWDQIEAYDEKLTEYGLNNGDLWSVITELTYRSFYYIERGDLPGVEKALGKLKEIGENYDNDFARTAMFRVHSIYSLKLGKLNQAIESWKACVPYANKSGQKAMLFCISAVTVQVYLRMGEMEMAEKLLESLHPSADTFTRIPGYIGYYYLSLLLFNLVQMENAVIRGDREKFDNLRKMVRVNAAKAVRNSRKTARDRTEAYKLTGVYWWLAGDQRKALKWWVRSIREGERLGARLELSRTYFEVGKRLKESKSKYDQLQGISAEAYLQRARGMFTEMGVEWDLEQLERLS